jgi:hypothetical protein
VHLAYSHPKIHKLVMWFDVMPLLLLILVIQKSWLMPMLTEMVLCLERAENGRCYAFWLSCFKPRCMKDSRDAWVDKRRKCFRYLWSRRIIPMPVLPLLSRKDPVIFKLQFLPLSSLLHPSLRAVTTSQIHPLGKLDDLILFTALD